MKGAVPIRHVIVATWHHPYAPVFLFMWKQRIALNDEAEHKGPVLKESGVRVDKVLRMVATGAGFSRVKRLFPTITEEDFHAALEFAASAVEEQYPSGKPRFDCSWARRIWIPRTLDDSAARKVLAVYVWNDNRVTKANHKAKLESRIAYLIWDYMAIGDPVDRIEYVLPNFYQVMPYNGTPEEIAYSMIMTSEVLASVRRKIDWANEDGEAEVISPDLYEELEECHFGEFLNLLDFSYRYLNGFL